MDEWLVQPSGLRDEGPCECCGNRTRRVWGELRRDGETRAVYYVKWAPGHREHDPTFDFVIGRWGAGMTPANRVGVSVRLRYPTDQFGFMVVDAGDSVLAGSELISRTLKRHEVIGTPLAAEVFSMLDAIWLRDERIAELA